MRSSKLLSLVLLFFLVFSASCGGGGGNTSSTSSASSIAGLPNGSTLPLVVGNNVLTLTVNGSTCSPATSSAYPNKPCVSVTICDAMDATCTSINDILFDTMDYGFRVFSQALNAASPALLTALLGENPVLVNNVQVYECVEYGDGATVWGPVVMADLVLGNEPAVQVPIQIIGSTDGNPSGVCAGSPLLSSPGVAHYNGSLGLGFLIYDFGPY